MGSSRSVGLSGLLAFFRVYFNSKISQLVLKSLLREYNVDGETHVLLADLLALYADERVHCPAVARFAGEMFSLWMKLALALLKTDDKVARELLRDPVIRRGVVLLFKSIAENGLTKPLRMYAPYFVVWNFTNMCNLKCMHCYQRAGRPLPNELTLSEKMRLILELDKAFVCGVALSGGEPTIHPDFLQVVHEIARRGMYAAVATNGMSFADESFVVKCKKAGLRLAEISLDSSRPEVHDRFRGLDGAWERTVKGIRNCVRHGIFTAIATTITKLNIDDVENMLDLAESLGVRRVVFFNFIPVGRGRDNIRLDLTPEEREELLRTLYRESTKRKIEIVLTAPQYGRVVLQLSRGVMSSPTHFTPAMNWSVYRAAAELIGGCGAGRVYCAIEPDGTVTPCVFMPIPVGNVRKDSIIRLWSECWLFNALRDRDSLKRICRICRFRDICGGCRARAYAYFNDPFEDDPGCIYCRARYYKLVRELGLEVVSRQAKPEAIRWKV